MAQEEKKAGAAGKVVLVIVLALIVALGVFAGMVYSSYQRIMPFASQIEASAATIGECAQAYDVDGVTSELAQVDSALDGIAAELDGGVWDVAACVPVLGEDVRGARTLVAVGQDVMASIVMPVSDVAQTLPSGALNSLGKGLVGAATGVTGEFVLSGASDVANALAGIDGMVETLRAAGPRLDADAQQLAALSDFHFDELNQARDELAGVVDDLRSVLDQISPALEGYASAKQVASDAVDAAGQVAGQIADAAGQALGEAADAVNQAFPEAAKKAQDFVDGAKEFGEGAKSFADGVRDAVLG